MYFLHVWQDLCTKTFWSSHYQNCCRMCHQVFAKGYGLCTKSAPSHFSMGTQEYLNAVFPAQWVWHGGPFSWPSRSPKIKQFNFSYRDISDVSSARLQYSEMTLFLYSGSKQHVMMTDTWYFSVQQSMVNPCGLCNEVGGFNYMMDHLFKFTTFRFYDWLQSTQLIIPKYVGY